MKYVILGSGGTGGCIGGFLAAAGKDVTLIARGKHLDSIHKNGLTIHSGVKGKVNLPSIKAMTTEEYEEKADVIFVSVKGYALDDTLPFLRKAADAHTIIIPILNIFGTGKYLAEKLPDLHVLEGCIYIVSHISSPGEITQSGKIFRVVYGTRGKTELSPKLQQIADDLAESGISAVISENIAADTFRKFTFISSFAAAGAYYDVSAGPIQQEGPERRTFIALVDEIIAVAKALGIDLPPDMAQKNLALIDGVAPNSTTSLQKDLEKGGQSEIDGLIFEVVRLGKEANVAVPNYEKIARHFGFHL